MKVIYYQLAILFTVALAYRAQPLLGLVVAIAWSLETFYLLGYPYLIVIQLGVIWGTFYVMWWRRRKNEELRQKDDRIRELEDIL